MIKSPRVSFSTTGAMTASAASDAYFKKERKTTVPVNELELRGRWLRSLCPSIDPDATCNIITIKNVRLYDASVPHGCKLVENVWIQDSVSINPSVFDRQATYII
jgi:hypothetical protein